MPHFSHVMPIFQDPDRQRFYDLWSDDHAGNERRDQTSAWTDNHDEHWEFNNDAGRDMSFSIDNRVPNLHLTKVHTGDRSELIQYIKRADTSVWEYGHASRDDPPRSPDDRLQMEGSSTHGGNPVDGHCANQGQEELASPADIARPRSALHSGDFRQGTAQQHGQEPSQSSLAEPHTPKSHLPHLGSSPTTPWFNPSVFASPISRQHSSTSTQFSQLRPTSRSRAPSLGSFSSSYVLKAPTSPLVYQANNTDLDFSPRSDIDFHSETVEKANRRRTLPPEYFRHLQSSPSAHSGGLNFRGSHPPGGHGRLFSYQPSHSQRNLSSTYSLQLASSAQTPGPRPRRPSLSTDSPSKSLAPMVGSYEECILRGRMSMNPSKPLDFTAQIGVLGKGKCKANLKCPPHVSVPFPAVFYSYPTSGRGRSISDDNPSPYVGLIDLDNSLPKDDSSTTRRRRRHHSPTGAPNDPIEHHDPEALRKREKRNRRAESPKSPLGGCYRIPQQGQLQIIIKNPNKTAVKLFLVPYDLSDMEPGTKTFIRQRSYSAGPIIDMPLTARKNYGTDRPEASLNASEDPKDKPILRYLIHLNICCPSRGRFYLHSSIRVVFANRVPDGKEKLRNEIQHPDPRYTPYRPSRETNSTHIGSKLATEKAFRRNADQGLVQELVSPGENSSGHLSVAQTRENLPFNFQHKQTAYPWGRLETSRSQKADSNERPDTETEMYHKLNKGDAGYGGSPFGSYNSSEAGESLLAKRLKGLEVQKHDTMDAI